MKNLKISMAIFTTRREKNMQNLNISDVQIHRFRSNSEVSIKSARYGEVRVCEGEVRVCENSAMKN